MVPCCCSRACWHGGTEAATHEATPAGGESGGRRPAPDPGAVIQKSLAPYPSYQPVRVPENLRLYQVTNRSRADANDCSSLPICCRIVASPVERSVPPAAPFFDLDKTIISRSSTLAFGPSFYRNGLFSRGDVARSTLAQMAFRFGSASHQRTERIRALRRIAQRRGWPVLTFGASGIVPSGMLPSAACEPGDQSTSPIGNARPYASGPFRRRKVSRTDASGHGNRAPTRDQPREASRGTDCPGGR